MAILKGAHIGEINFDLEILAIQKLGLDFAHPEAPYHESIPRGKYMPDVKIPTVWQASVAGFPNCDYTPDQIRNVLKQPNFNGWWILGNEQDLGFDKTPPATPQEYVKSIVENMLVIIPFAPAPRRFILSLGSRRGMDYGWSRDVLVEFQKTAPGILCMFDAFAINYYSIPLFARECIRWLRGVYDMIDELHLGDRKIWLKEVGASLPRNNPSESITFIERFFEIARNNQARGEMLWLEAVEWFSANDLSKYGMPYVTLYSGDELTPVGKAWAKA